MAICNVIVDSKFGYNQIKFLEESLVPEYKFEHWLYGPTWGNAKRDISGKNIHGVPSPIRLFTNLEFLKCAISSDAIILQNVNPVALLGLYPFIKKTALCFWGADLVWLVNNSSGSFVSKLAKKFCRSVAANAKLISTLTEGEYQRLSSKCRIRGLFVLGGVGMPRVDLKDISFSGMRDNRIIVGNSATASNRHEDVFKLLKPLKDSRYEVFVPLSYGDSEYRDRVLSLGNYYLGHSFHPLLELLPFEDYEVFLSTCSVGIFNQPRQQGFGNIKRLLASGSKIYLADDGDSLSHFIKMGANVFPISSICDSSVEDLFELPEPLREANRRLFSAEARYDFVVNAWKSIMTKLV